MFFKFETGTRIPREGRAWLGSLLALPLALGLSSCFEASMPVNEVATQGTRVSANSLSFRGEILPIITKRCASCHNAGSALPDWTSYNVAFSKKDRIYDRVVVKKDMPLGGSMDQEERDLIGTWISLGAPLDAPGEPSSPAPAPEVPPVSAPAPTPTEPAPVDGSISFEGAVKPKITSKVCAMCHNETSAIPNWLSYEVAYEKRYAIYERVIVKKDMPLGMPMSTQDRALIADWVKAGAPRGDAAPVMPGPAPVPTPTETPSPEPSPIPTETPVDPALYCVDVRPASNAHRNRGTSPLEQDKESEDLAGKDLPSNYVELPKPIGDSSGAPPQGWVVNSDITYAPRPQLDCGTSQPTIAERIADCARKNGANASWEGSKQANSGEANWVLVTRAATDKEVWQDQRTQLLWSSVVLNTDWCRAAGNADPNDPAYACTHEMIQPSLPKIQSACSEAMADLIPIPETGENWETGTYSPAKGFMGKRSTPSVRWRLPSRYDYQQAEIDGIRFVLPGFPYNRESVDYVSPGESEWTSTVYSEYRNIILSGAWMFWGYSGSTNIGARLNPGKIRCVGR